MWCRYLRYTAGYVGGGGGGGALRLCSTNIQGILLGM